MVDPWAGFYEGTRQLNDTLEKLPENNVKQQMARMQLAQGQQAVQDDQQARQALQQSGGDLTRTLPALAQAGNVKAYAGMQKTITDQQEAKIAQQAGIQKLKVQEASGILSLPDEQVQAGAIASAKRVASITGDDPTQFIQTLSQMSPQQIKEMAMKAAIPAKEQYPSADALMHNQTTIRGQDLSEQGRVLSNDLAERRLGMLEKATLLKEEKVSTGGLSAEALDAEAEIYRKTGVIRGTRNADQVSAIKNRNAEQLKALGQTGENVVANASDLKAINSSLSTQEKQLGAMGSFVKNIDAQYGRLQEIAGDLASSDIRLLNMPRRALLKTVEGSPLQSKVDMYVAEIASETAKLAGGSTGSVSELSQGMREKWDKIIDPNLSIKDLTDLLAETKHAAAMRMESVYSQLEDTQRRRDSIGTGQKAPTSVNKIGRFQVEVH